MADIADLANEQVAKLEELAMRKFKAEKYRLKAEHTGKCLNCEEVLNPPKRWCDTDCRDDWERRSK